MNEEKCFVRLGEASKHFGVSNSTIRRWTDTGKLEYKRLSSGQRVINIKEKDNNKKEESRFDILYSRVSSHKQEDDLQRQKQYLEENCQTKEFTHIQDIASGLNFKRKGLIKILDSVKEGKVRTIIVASKDRMARFGFDLIEWLCHEYGTKILVLDNQNQSPTEELGKDLLSIVQIYCCRWNGKRRYKNNKESKTEVVSNQRTKTFNE
jgi:predicted site-specific integrase-resolvase